MEMRKLFHAVLLAGVLVSLSLRKAGGGEPIVMPENLPKLVAEEVGTPVFVFRPFTHAFGTNDKGEWIFITQFMNYKGTTDFSFQRKTVPGTEREYVVFDDTKKRPDAEWVILNLKSGDYEIFKLPGFHAWRAVRAENGRIFFAADFMHIYYYDPADGEMHILGQLSEWKPYTNDRGLYRLMLGPDGMLYGSTQSYNGMTSVVRINPDTLAYKIITEVGEKRKKSGLTYGYYLGIEPPWAYVAVGQNHWELMAVNFETGEKRFLGERKGDKARIVVSQGAVVRAQFSDASGRKTFVLSGGRLIENPEGGGLPAGVTPIAEQEFPRIEWKNTRARPLPGEVPTAVISEMGVLDSQGRGYMVWQEAGETNRAEIRFSLAEPEIVTSLIDLPDGSIFGAVRQYNGFFRYFPGTDELKYFGKAGPSTPRMALHDGKVYYFGYPNCNLWVYDPNKDWKITPQEKGGNKVMQEGDNPQLIGYFGNGMTEAHHSRDIAAAPNGRIYLLGHRERWSTGAGLGYYDTDTGKKFGLGEAMKDLEPRSLVVLSKPGRVVVSGLPRKEEEDGAHGETAGEFRVFDLDLKFVENLPLRKGFPDTGTIQNFGLGDRFFGIVKTGDDTSAIYLYSLEKKKAVLWRELDRIIHGLAFRRRADGTWWLVAGNILCRLEPATLDLTAVGLLNIEKSPEEWSRRVRRPVWSGRDLYFCNGGTLLRVKNVE
jgi:hypothetical protein